MSAVDTEATTSATHPAQGYPATQAIQVPAPTQDPARTVW